jgi:hypothetical protein
VSSRPTASAGAEGPAVLRAAKDPAGTFLSSLKGLGPVVDAHPALKRWAIFFRLALRDLIVGDVYGNRDVGLRRAER